MTRKHYIAVAKNIKSEIDAANAILNTESTADHDIEVYERAVGQKSAAERIARGFADLAASDNPAFDRSRFMTACGVIV